MYVCACTVFVCVAAHRIFSSSSARIEREKKGARRKITGSRSDFYQVIDLGLDGSCVVLNPLGSVLDGLGSAKFFCDC